MPNTTKVERAKTRLDTANRLYERVKAERELAAEAYVRVMTETDSADPEPPPIGSVIRFQIQHHSGETVYSYVAYRAPNGVWYLTGQEKRYSWKTLLTLMRRDLSTRMAEGRVRFYLYPRTNGDKGKWVGRDE